MAASGCTPSATSCCQGPRLTTDTLLLDPSPSPVQHSKQHTNKIVAVKSSLKTLCIIDWSALTHRKWVDSPTPRNYQSVSDLRQPRSQVRSKIRTDLGTRLRPPCVLNISAVVGWFSMSPLPRLGLSMVRMCRNSSQTLTYFQDKLCMHNIDTMI